MMEVVIGVASACKVGETVCGDASAIVTFARGTLLCLADGLGHGPQARAAADVACDYVRENADTPLETLMRGLDVALRGTRGAAISLLALHLDDAKLQFAGIGNVELRAISRAKVAPPTASGIVGQGIRSVRVWEYPLAEGDLMVLASDGISTRYDLASLAHHQPQMLAGTMLSQQHKAHDDGCCVVAKIVAT